MEWEFPCWNSPWNDTDAEIWILGPNDTGYSVTQVHLLLFHRNFTNFIGSAFFLRFLTLYRQLKEKSLQYRYSTNTRALSSTLTPSMIYWTLTQQVETLKPYILDASHSLS